MAKRPRSEMRQFIVPARVVKHYDVIVEAFDEEDAARKFEAMQWLSEEVRDGETVDYDINGKIVENI